MSEKEFDDTYCIKQCENGIAKSNEFLDNNNSAYDAAIDMWAFVEECKKTCPHCKNNK